MKKLFILCSFIAPSHGLLAMQLTQVQVLKFWDTNNNPKIVSIPQSQFDLCQTLVEMQKDISLTTTIEVHSINYKDWELIQPLLKNALNIKIAPDEHTKNSRIQTLINKLEQKKDDQLKTIFTSANMLEVQPILNSFEKLACNKNFLEKFKQCKDKHNFNPYNFTLDFQKIIIKNLQKKLKNPERIIESLKESDDFYNFLAKYYPICVRFSAKKPDGKTYRSLYCSLNENGKIINFKNTPRHSTEDSKDLQDHLSITQLSGYGLIPLNEKNIKSINAILTLLSTTIENNIQSFPDTLDALTKTQSIPNQAITWSPNYWQKNMKRNEVIIPAISWVFLQALLHYGLAKYEYPDMIPTSYALCSPSILNSINNELKNEILLHPWVVKHMNGIKKGDLLQKHDNSIQYYSQLISRYALYIFAFQALYHVIQSYMA